MTEYIPDLHRELDLHRHAVPALVRAAQHAPGRQPRRRGRRLPIHSGPRFGLFLCGYAEEYVKAPGELRVGVDLEASDIEIATPAELRRLAADATAAAEWLESQQ